MQFVETMLGYIEVLIGGTISLLIIIASARLIIARKKGKKSISNLSESLKIYLVV